MVGTPASCTVTVNVQVDCLPLSSVAVAVTVVSPIGRVLPDGGSLVIVSE